MALRSAVAMMAAAVILLSVSRIGRAQQAAGAANGFAAPAAQGKVTGILTTRLSGRQLRTWKAIWNIALAQDQAGLPRHPKLHSLWRWAETSGHSIYIEMPEPKSVSPYRVGSFSIENLDSGNQEPVGVIRFYLSVIDSASTSGRTRRPGGFMPFEGFRDKKQRYAEVLGHELVHALLTLTDANHARLARELDKETADLMLYRWKHNGVALDPETLDRLKRILYMSEEIERQAEAAEVEIWRELAAGNRGIERAPATAVLGTPGATPIRADRPPE